MIDGLRRLFPPGDVAHVYPRMTSARVLAAVFNVVVGLRLLWPDDVLGSVPSYRLLDDHFFGDVWLGLGLLAYGVAMTWGLYSDRFSAGVGVATWLSLVTWLLVAVDLAIVNVSQFGTLAYVLVAALNGFAYAHLAQWRAQLSRGASS